MAIGRRNIYIELLTLQLNCPLHAIQRMKVYLITPHDDIKFKILNKPRPPIKIEASCLQSF